MEDINLRKICVITGTRAEYGLLYYLMKELQNSADFTLQIIATGMHLSPEFGLTYQTIEADGFTIDAKVEMLLSSDSPVGIAKSIGLGVIGFADTLNKLQPDLVVVLGDRYEILAAVQTALIAKIPVAHLAGGDITEGVFDESIRHSITKMSHLHFVTNEQSAQRVRQLGESPAHIFNVGSPGIDYINRVELLTREELSQQLNFSFQAINFLVTFHPLTLDNNSSEVQVMELLNALSKFPDAGIIFTKPNSDTDGRKIIALLEEFVQSNPHTQIFSSLGQLRYLSTIAQVDAVIGNSSSGLYEVPSFKKPTVNIGDRQKSRLSASSVLNCEPTTEDIYQAIKKALALDCTNAINPYGDGNTSQKIVAILKNTTDYPSLLKKHFYLL